MDPAGPPRPPTSCTAHLVGPLQIRKSALRAHVYRRSLRLARFDMAILFFLIVMAGVGHRAPASRLSCAAPRRRPLAKTRRTSTATAMHTQASLMRAKTYTPRPTYDSATRRLGRAAVLVEYTVIVITPTPSPTWSVLSTSWEPHSGGLQGGIHRHTIGVGLSPRGRTSSPLVTARSSVRAYLIVRPNSPLPPQPLWTGQPRGRSPSGPTSHATVPPSAARRWM